MSIRNKSEERELPVIITLFLCENARSYDRIGSVMFGMSCCH